MTLTDALAVIAAYYEMNMPEKDIKKVLALYTEARIVVWAHAEKLRAELKTSEGT